MDPKIASPKTPEQEYTILRIKRKRDEDVPDVLVVDKKGGKRRKSGMDVFQFAETIDEVAWKELEQDELRKRISAFSKSSTKTVPNPTQKTAGPSIPETMSRQMSTQTNGAARQYRVINQEARQDTRPSRFYPMPPKVRSHKELQKASRIRIYDAELAHPESSSEMDPEMEKFQDLVNDYLKVEETGEGTSLPSSIPPLSGLPSSTSGDYVYDIFYHRPSTLSEQAIAANMAIVTGLPPQSNDEDDLDSESEVEDEADEDSNAEDYYRNDYPDDEESSDSHSENSDLYSDDDFEASSRFEPDH